MILAPWINPPNYLAAMQAGANLGLNVRQQNAAESDAADRLRMAEQDLMLRRAAEQRRAEEARTLTPYQQAALGLRAAQINRTPALTPYQEASLRLREQQMNKTPTLTPYQDASLGLSKERLDLAREKAEKPTEPKPITLDQLNSTIKTLQEQLDPVKAVKISDQEKAEATVKLEAALRERDARLGGMLPGYNAQVVPEVIQPPPVTNWFGRVKQFPPVTNWGVGAMDPVATNAQLLNPAPQAELLNPLPTVGTNIFVFNSKTGKIEPKATNQTRLPESLNNVSFR